MSRPVSDADFERYFALRWQLLRAPWEQPRGSERDEFEDVAFHLQVQDRSGRLIGIGRLHCIDDTRGQIRYMAVVDAWRGRGVGTALLQALEQQARDWDLGEIRLHARQAAVDFYTHHGYAVVAPSHTLFGSIPHFLMRKPLP
ncbi:MULTISPECIES: GNAT family N-acetyltransferase [Thiohalobacter]|uniref:GNAT family N-acetyltransferase n=1 Tax=Thiohalobacter TaxID=1273155 RepID=UPI0012FD8345|nr:MULTISPECIES: GNAT family N-acetyltransferase [Thiohalobacter]